MLILTHYAILDRIVLVMRYGMVLLRHADLRIGALAEFARHHECEDARGVGLIGHCQQIEEQRHMFVERIGNADRSVRRIHRGRATSFLPLDAALDFTEIVQIIGQPRAIAHAQAMPDAFASSTTESRMLRSSGCAPGDRRPCPRRQRGARKQRAD